jgi:hypothetical protein
MADQANQFETEATPQKYASCGVLPRFYWGRPHILAKTLRITLQRIKPFGVALDKTAVVEGADANRRGFQPGFSAVFAQLLEDCLMRHEDNCVGQYANQVNGFFANSGWHIVELST